MFRNPSLYMGLSARRTMRPIFPCLRFAMNTPLRALLLTLLGLLALATGFAQAQEGRVGVMPPIPVRPIPLPPLFRVPDAKLPVRLDRLAVSAEVAGGVARTRIELTVANPNDRVLEGELQFPLLEGQTVTGFALDIGGHLRAASPVDKARGQQVFEEIVRRGADPALLEKTEGNNFKLRVYPLPAKGTRRIALVLTETLTPGKDGRLNWRAPLAFADNVAELSLEVRVSGIVPAKLALGPALTGAGRSADGTEALVTWRQGNWKPGRNLVELSWPGASGPAVRLDRFDGEQFFYADVPVDFPAAPRPAPKRVVLVWDASGSGAGRDHARELEFLDAWFRKLGQVEVSLVVARDRAEAPRNFLVKGGQWLELRKVLAGLPYDGATDPSAWAPPEGAAADMALLFSDGLANWGTGATPALKLPLYAVNTSAGADAGRLRALAEASGGRYLDLLRLSPREAVTELSLRRARLLGMHAVGAERLVSASDAPEGGRLLLAGVMTAAKAEVVLSLETPKGERLERRIAVGVPAGKAAAGYESLFPGLAAQHWASLNLSRLEADKRLHRAEIRRLGQRFGLVTAETSLIVLESLDDYLRYEIVPPAGDLRVEYQQRMAGRQAARQKSRGDQVDDLARRFAEVVKWWEKDFPKGAPPKAEPVKLEAAAAPGSRPDRAVAAVAAAAPPPAPMPMMAAAPSARKAMAERQAGGGRVSTASDAAPVAASIQLQKWQPDTPSARRLRDAADGDRYAIYLDERSGLSGSTAFFLDAADVFFDRGQTELAVRILSNLAEMNLENRAILRILAYRLRQAGLPKLAIPLLQRVRELAPDEPQSWRDLGLAYAADGQDQAAVDALWQTVSLPMQGRFADIDLIALEELNAIAARHPGLDLTAVDARLRRNLPVDVRAVLAWDADSTDIDLWVIDPNGEKAYYGHRLTWQGGRMTRDFTQGYGPEAFSLKKAKPGRYEVRAHFYGHRQQLVSPYTTLMLRLSTGFGTSGQQDRDITLRLTERNDQVLVGSFEVAGDKSEP